MYQTPSLLSPPASEFLIVTLKSEFNRIYALSAINYAASAKQSVSASGNRCLVPWSVIPVDASDSFDTILDVVS